MSAATRPQRPRSPYTTPSPTPTSKPDPAVYLFACSALGIAPAQGLAFSGHQDAALAPARPGRRKIVLATNIAETSLTIEGVRAVIDGGPAGIAQSGGRVRGHFTVPKRGGN